MYTRSTLTNFFGSTVYHLIERSSGRDADQWLPERRGSGNPMTWTPRQLVLLGLIRDLRVEDDSSARKKIAVVHSREVRDALYEALMTCPWGQDLIKVERPPMSYYYRPDWTIPDQIKEAA